MYRKLRSMRIGEAEYRSFIAQTINAETWHSRYPGFKVRVTTDDSVTGEDSTAIQAPLGKICYEGHEGHRIDLLCMRFRPSAAARKHVLRGPLSSHRDFGKLRGC